jgi:hypothetical protein
MFSIDYSDVRKDKVVKTYLKQNAQFKHVKFASVRHLRLSNYNDHF